MAISKKTVIIAATATITVAAATTAVVLWHKANVEDATELASEFIDDAFTSIVDECELDEDGDDNFAI